MNNAIQAGSCIRFDYRGESRQIEVDTVRQVGGIKAQPIRTMVTGYDLNKKAFRNFYRDEMQNLVWVTT